MAKRKSVADRMAARLQELADERQARIQAKLDDGYRPRLDDKGNVVLVKVAAGEG